MTRLSYEERKARKAEREQKALAWFTDEFLPSLEQRATNPKYPNQVILSDRQSWVCEKYMSRTETRTDYGYNVTYNLKANGKRYAVTYRGKYTFLSWSKC